MTDSLAAHPSLCQQEKIATDCLGGKSKRLFDLVFGLTIFILIIPILLIAATTLKLAGARPVFAKEPRLGFRGRVFTLVELATSTRAGSLSDAVGTACRRTRVARIGGFLRESGINKLPQLVNVLRGEMSLVGPRALRPTDAWRQSDRIAACLAARPGLVQARKRSMLDALRSGETSDSDLEYVQNWHLGTDVAALLRTIFTLKEL